MSARLTIPGSMLHIASNRIAAAATPGFHGDKERVYAFRRWLQRFDESTHLFNAAGHETPGWQQLIDDAVDRYLQWGGEAPGGC